MGQKPVICLLENHQSSVHIPNSYPPIFSLKKRELPNNSLVLTKVGWLVYYYYYFILGVAGPLSNRLFK
jgi:hypothetical protein